MTWQSTLQKFLEKVKTVDFNWSVDKTVKNTQYTRNVLVLCGDLIACVNNTRH